MKTCCVSYVQLSFCCNSLRFKTLINFQESLGLQVNSDVVSYVCQQEALFPDYVHLSTALLPKPFFSSKEITATAFFNILSWSNTAQELTFNTRVICVVYVFVRGFLLTFLAYRKYMVCPVKMNRMEMMTRMPKCCGWGAEMTIRKCSRSIR